MVKKMEFMIKFMFKKSNKDLSPKDLIEIFWIINFFWVKQKLGEKTRPEIYWVKKNLWDRHNRMGQT